MKIEKVTLRLMEMEMKAPFTTSFGTFKNRAFILVEATADDGTTGWGETVAFYAPLYSCLLYTSDAADE